MNANHIAELIQAAKATLASPGVTFRDQAVRRTLSLATAAAEAGGMGAPMPTNAEARLHAHCDELRRDLAAVLCGHGCWFL